MTVSHDEDLDALIRRSDPDRWLAARFAPEASRRELLALYALNHELARVAESVSNLLVGEIRLAWWREALEELAAGEAARAHPVLRAIGPAVTAGRLPLAPLLALVRARASDLEPAPFADEAALTDYIDGTAGSVMAAAAHLLDGRSAPTATAAAARAWGWTGLFRAGPALEARGRRWTPLAWVDAEPREIAAHVAHRVEAARQAANVELRDLPVAAFPAVAYATLARPYLRRGELTDFGRQARLVSASMRGRI